ncbi:MAG: YihY/virulence factor BrkB family protein [Nitrospirota bacterium]|nr:YihY/virulence factor BrkB family protein [Nitrospirota bacterium]
MQLLKTLGSSITSFFRDDCFYLAASIAYFLIVSMVPLSLLMVSLFGYILGGNQELYNFLLSKLGGFFPAVTSDITTELKNLITYRGISLITMFIYGFLALQLFYSVERAMDVIFRVPKKRHFLLSMFWTVFIVTLVIFFWLFSFTLSSFAMVFREHPMNVFGIALSKRASILLRYVAPFVVVLLTFTTVYKIIPHVKVRAKDAFAGGLLVTVLWEVAKHVFTMAVENTAYIGKIYGPLTAFILFLLWMYYLSCIFLLGGQFVNNLSGGK